MRLLMMALLMMLLTACDAAATVVQSTPQPSPAATQALLRYSGIDALDGVLTFNYPEDWQIDGSISSENGLRLTNDTAIVNLTTIPDLLAQTIVADHNARTLLEAFVATLDTDIGEISETTIGDAEAVRADAGGELILMVDKGAAYLLVITDAGGASVEETIRAILESAEYVASA